MTTTSIKINGEHFEISVSYPADQMMMHKETGSVDTAENWLEAAQDDAYAHEVDLEREAEACYEESPSNARIAESVQKGYDEDLFPVRPTKTEEEKDDVGDWIEDEDA